MKRFPIVVLFVLAYASSSTYAQRQFVHLTNLKDEYKSLSEVKPVILNKGHQSIYLWPQECGEAMVSYRSGEYWDDSDLKPCEKLVKPIEIKPGHSYCFPPLVIRFEEAEEGRFREERIGKPGDFRITVSYSFKPFYKNGAPQLRESVSKDFSLVAARQANPTTTRLKR
jgi:hypothetical protein